jgi:hypothetical protein
MESQLPIGPVELNILMPHGIAQNHAATSTGFGMRCMIAAKQGLYWFTKVERFYFSC